MNNYVNKDSIYNLLFITSAVKVVPDDSADLPIPGFLFLDGNSVAGNVTVDLLNGGKIVIPLTVDKQFMAIVRRVYSTGTTATGILLNTISQRQGKK